MTSFLKSFIGPPMCDNCGVQPKFSGFDYCGKTCAAEAEKKKKSAGRGSAAGRGGPSANPTYSRNGFPQTPTGSYASAASGPNYGFDSMMCEQCGIRPKNQDRQAGGQTVVHPYCGRNCAEAARQKTAQQQAYGQVAAGPAPPVTRLTAMDPTHALAKHIYDKFQERWDSEEVPPPTVMAIYRIQLPGKFYNRFDGALEMNEGANVITTYYGGQSICEVGCKGEPEGTLCSWESCSICVVLKGAFTTLEFGDDAYDGTYGAGIYTHLSPTMAHRWTLAKNPEITSCRAIIQCRVVRAGNLEPGQPHAAFIDETGRVFCKDKRAIIPTHLIIYDPSPRLLERRSTGRP
ncbi:hypothetical protein M407DRAFT_246620 [Tulasnella calospora MUT 4182]|uniref:PARP catalytic domain-containing protein n=1 Tax=Tulasnella calospora MUT 4182 TaxID=1051891 RepID=A0A0C3Q3K7_9AGAM|nr:hypothetical protein M407DRAFT_246814 [Tulasnella calospora MUT 4182]KIO17888.1 hypothetical protein M407DRAFT_246620 [Tulasnella calospora MUT 4182]